MINKISLPPDDSSLFPRARKISPKIDLPAHLPPVWVADSLPNLGNGVAEEIFDDADLSSSFDDDTSSTTTNPIVSYLREVKSIPLLSRDQETILSRRIEEGESHLVEETLSSILALRWTLTLGERIAAGLVNVRDVVQDSDERSGDLVGDERVLKARFRTRMKKLQDTAKSHERTAKELKKPMTASRRQRLDRKLSQQRGKITKIIRSLQLNRQYMGKVIEEHEAVYERVKKLERTAQGWRKQNQAIRAIEEESGMPIEEIGRRVATLRDQKAQIALAKKDFVQANLRLVAAVAKKYSGRGLS